MRNTNFAKYQFILVSLKIHSFVFAFQKHAWQTVIKLLAWWLSIAGVIPVSGQQIESGYWQD
jgi:hypothetical protein